MAGTLLNVAAILLGGALGLLLGARFPERMRQTITAGLGLFILAMGVQMFLATKNSLIVLGSVALGGVLGELCRIEDRLLRLGQALETRFLKVTEQHEAESRFARGFLTTALMFCVGPLAILGPIQNGLTGNYQILAVKSILDGLVSLAFAASLGPGVLFSALAVLVYQGGISLLAAQANAVITDAMTAELTAVGGVLIMGIAISGMLEIRKIRVGNLLPALVIAPLIVAGLAFFQK